MSLGLMTGDVEVLAVDADQRIVESLAGRLTQVVSADTTSEEALRQLSVHEFYWVVIAVGTHLEASILTATVCLGFETPEIWAKAISEPHAKILSLLGVHHIVRPEHDMGNWVAHLVAGRMMDYMEFDDVCDGQDHPAVRHPRPTAAHYRSSEAVRSGHRGDQKTRRGLHLRHAGDGSQPRRCHIASGKTHDVEYFSDQG
jgi:TrkA-N domain